MEANDGQRNKGGKIEERAREDWSKGSRCMLTKKVHRRQDMMVTVNESKRPKSSNLTIN